MTMSNYCHKTVLRFMTMSNYFYRAPFYDNERLLLPCSVLWQWVTTFTVLRFMTMSNYFYRAPFYDNE